MIGPCGCLHVDLQTACLLLPQTEALLPCQPAASLAECQLPLTPNTRLKSPGVHRHHADLHVTPRLQRNYRYFLTFIFSATILCLEVLGTCIANLVEIDRKDHVSFGRAIQREPANLVLMAYTVLAVW